MPDRALTLAIRNSKGFFRELIRLAEEQGWTYRKKDEGLLFFPPTTNQRPGTEHGVFAADPRNESHTIRHIQQRFKKAGLKFEPTEKKHMQQPTPKSTLPTNGVTPPISPETPFAGIRRKINDAISALAEVENDLKRIEADTAQMQKLRDLLKTTLGG